MIHYVYFIQQVGTSDSPVKIGYSKDPTERLRTLQTANHKKLKICFSLPFETECEARRVERVMHSLASKKCRKLNGEWFIIYMSWKKFIAQAMKIHDSINPSI
jgi:hypothetical protein